MKTEKVYAKYLLLMVLALQLTSCEPETDDSSDDTNHFTGVWVRTLGASGDETNLAIGGIAGEPSSRVFMCEKQGSTAAGFYKGNIYGNTVVWDAVHGLPESSFRMVGSQLEFSYPSVAESIPTLYDSGNWSAECGSLYDANNGGGNNNGGGDATTGNATFWTQSDLGCGNISVNLNGSSGTIGSYYTSGNPGCNAGGSANFELPAGTYNYTASCANYSWDGTITITNGQCATMQLSI